jgi:hypothetical protein
MLGKMARMKPIDMKTRSNDNKPRCFKIIDVEQDLSPLAKADLEILFPGYSHHLRCPVRQHITRVYIHLSRDEKAD